LAFIAQLAPCRIALEACAGAHHWARAFQKLGHEVKLIAPQYVKPYVKGNKNDYNDADAITEAVQRPTMRFVPIKTQEQQDIQALHRLRERTVKERTALANQIRGLLAEYGIVIRLGITAVRKALPEILEDGENGLTLRGRACFTQLRDELMQIDAQCQRYEQMIVQVNQEYEVCRRLDEVIGIGPITATATYAAAGSAQEFRNGRHFSAWLGLVPKQHSSGGKDTLLGISKRGNAYLRTLFIHGARAVLRYAATKTDRFSRWANAVHARRGHNRACVAVANKLARIAWVVMAKGESYRPAV
jgi:transposase